MSKQKIFDIVQKAFEKFFSPAQNMDMVHVYVGQMFCFWVIWGIYKGGIEQIKQEWPQINDDIVFYVTVVLLIAAHFGIAFFAPYYLEKKGICIRLPFFLFEYDTFYQKTFLKEKYKPYRIMLKLFMSCFPIVSLHYILNRQSIDALAFVYFEVVIYNLFAGYTKEEYEEGLIKPPYISSGNEIKKYEEKINQEKTLRLWLGKEYFGVPEQKAIPEYDDKMESFLYRKTGSLDHIELMWCLFHEKSVLTDTPFYKDMGVALFFPLHEALIKGKKIIFFIGGSESREEITEWIRDGLKSVTRMEEFWKIVNLLEKERNWDIGVVTSDDMTMLYEMENLLVNPSGFVVVFIHPERLLLEAQNELYEWGYLLSLQPVKPVYVIIERAIMGLLDLVSHIFVTEFKYVSKAAEPAYMSRTYVLDGERDDLNKKTVGMTPDIGIGGMLAEFAEEAGLRDVYWMSGNKIPFYDIDSIRKQHLMTGVVNQISCRKGLWSLSKQEISIQILNDEINNVWELLRQAKTRGKKIGIISVVSNRYLLLDYMLANMEMFANDIYAIPAMAANFSESILNRSVILLKMLLYRKMSGEEIRAYKSRYSQKNHLGENKLYEDDVLSEEELSEIEQEINDCLNNEEVRIHIKRHNKDEYYIMKSPQVERLCDELTAPAVYFDEEEKTKTFLGGKHRWQIDQVYLPGQAAVLNGKLYQVKGRERIFINSTWEEVLTVRRFRSGMIYRSKYFQDRVYHFDENIAVCDYQEEKFGIKWTMLTVSFSVETKGYYTLSGKEKRVEYTSVSLGKKREYKESFNHRKNAIALRFQAEDNWEARRTMAIVFGEILKTLFPEGYPYIAVLALQNENIDTQDDVYKYLYYKTNMRYIDGSYDILIVEDSRLELGILSMINRHMEHILRIVYSYCKWWRQIKTAPNSSCTTEEQKWSSEILKLDSFISLLDEVQFGTLSDHRDVKKVFNIPISKVRNYCRCCWKEIPAFYRRKCDDCKNSFLTSADYAALANASCSLLTVVFGMQITFGLHIVVQNRILQQKAIKRVVGNRNRFICTPYSDYNAAMACMIHEIVCCWIESRNGNNDEIQLITGKVYIKEEEVKQAIGDWYELWFMYAFKLYELFGRRKSVILSKTTKEVHCLNELCQKWPFEEYKVDTPLSKYI